MAAGVAPDVIEATLADAGDEDERADALARSRVIPRLGSLEPAKARSLGSHRCWSGGLQP